MLPMHLMTACPAPAAWRPGRLLGALLASFLVLAGTRAPAVQLPAGAGAAYSCQSWHYENGLPHNVVQSVTQTRDGYIWVGTRNGLARFDGHQFKVFTPDNTPWLQRRWISRIYGARDGSLWIAHSLAGLLRYQDGLGADLTAASGLTNTQVLSFHQARDGTLWLGTLHGLHAYRNGKFSALPDPRLHGVIRDISEDHEGHLWVTTDRGVIALLGGVWHKQYTRSHGLTDNLILAVHRDRLGQLWAGSDYGLDEIGAAGQVRRYAKADGLSSDSATVLAEDRQGTLWIGSRGGLDSMREGVITPLLDDQGVAFGGVNEIIEDFEGNLWVATRDGLFRVQARRLLTLTQKDGLPNNNVLSVLEDASGILWVGTSGGISMLTNGHFFSFGLTNGLPVERFLSLAQDGAGRVWMGADYSGGVYRYEDGVFTRFAAAQGLRDSAPRVMLEDRAGTFWIGMTKTLYAFRNNQFQPFTQAHGLTGGIIQALLTDRTGAFWVGTDLGLCRQHGERFEAVPLPDTRFPQDARSENITALHEDSRGRLWLGTKGGLRRLEGGRATSYTTRDGLPHNEITTILEDEKGWLWMGSPYGLFRFELKICDAYDQGQTNSLRCYTYGKPDGMLSSTCNGTAKPSGWRSRDGRLWFPTIKGLVVTDPDRAEVLNTLPPPVAVEEVYADKKSLAMPESSPNTPPLLIAPPGRGELEFHYAALSFTAPERNRFRYRLEGVDPDWVEAGNRQVAYYNNLPPGRHVFHVIACNNDGVWNQAGAECRVLLQPHFWQTWWFFCLAVLLAVGGLIGLTRFLILGKMRRKLALLHQEQAMERERTRIAQDMHDDLGARLTEMLLLGDATACHPQLPPEAASNLRRINSTAREVVDNLDAIVWTVNPRNDSLGRFTAYVNEYLGGFVGVSPTRWRIEEPENLPDLPLSSEVRHHLFMVIKEAVHNIMKHAQAREARFHLALQDAALSIRIEDNGRGFVLAPGAGGGNGLRNMRARIEAIGGTFHLASQPGQGTQIHLLVPLEKHENRPDSH